MRTLTWMPVLLVLVLSSSAFGQPVDRPVPSQSLRLTDGVPAAVSSVVARPRWSDPQPSNAVKGVVIGLIVGAAAGIVFVGGNCEGGCAGDAAAFAVLFGGAGACIGGLAGAVADARNRVDPATGAVGHRHGAAVGFRRIVTWRF